MKDNGVNVIVGMRRGQGWKPAQQTVGSRGRCSKRPPAAAQSFNIYSDAGQKDWPRLKPYLTAARPVFFARLRHRVQRPDWRGAVHDIDVIPQIPGRKGTTVRRPFLKARHQCQPCHSPGCHRLARPPSASWHCDRPGLPVRNHIPEGSLQRPDWRAAALWGAIYGLGLPSI